MIIVTFRVVTITKTLCAYSFPSLESLRMPPQYLQVAHLPSVSDDISKCNPALAVNEATPPIAAKVNKALVLPNNSLRFILVLSMVSRISLILFETRGYRSFKIEI